MSANARNDHGSRHLCSCRRRATFVNHRGRGRVSRQRHARADHPLCSRCWRALLDHYRPAPPARRWLADELLARLLVGEALWRETIGAEPTVAMAG